MSYSFIYCIESMKLIFFKSDLHLTCKKSQKPYKNIEKMFSNFLAHVLLGQESPLLLTAKDRGKQHFH